MPTMSDGPDWEEQAQSLLERSMVPAAQAAGRLLASARAHWEGRVVPRTSMHDLLFTVPGYPYPFEDRPGVVGRRRTTSCSS